MQVSVSNSYLIDKSLEVLHLKRGKYINIDSITRNGIKKAKNLSLASSGLADVIFIFYLHDESCDIFLPEIKGQYFTLLHYPIECLISLYYYHKGNNQYHKDILFQDYMDYGVREDNWMTQFLCNKETGPIYESDYHKAKNTLKTNCLIGFVSELEISMKHFERFFH